MVVVSMAPEGVHRPGPGMYQKSRAAGEHQSPPRTNARRILNQGSYS